MIVLLLLTVFAMGVSVGYVGGRKRTKKLRVEVGPSNDGSGPMQHMMSARIVTRTGRAIHFKRVNMNDDEWEDQLGEAVAEMKSNLETMKALERIARQ